MAQEGCRRVDCASKQHFSSITCYADSADFTSDANLRPPNGSDSRLDLTNSLNSSLNIAKRTWISSHFHVIHELTLLTGPCLCGWYKFMRSQARLKIQIRIDVLSDLRNFVFLLCK